MLFKPTPKFPLEVILISSLFAILNWILCPAAEFIIVLPTLVCLRE